MTLICVAAMFCAAGCNATDAEVVAVIGTGDMGDSLGPRFAELGYRVVYGSRTPRDERVQALAGKTGNGASAATPEEAARQAGIVVLAVPWPAMEAVAQNLGDLGGKIVIDVSMTFDQAEDGYPKALLQTSSAEMIQGWNPGAKVVKAFATMGSGIIDEPMRAGGVVSIPVASDDKDAKEKVAGIVAAMGLDPVDFGPLHMARQIESLQLIYMIPLVQNRTENWEFHFRRSDQYGCYLSGDLNAEVGPAAFDADDLAVFPESGEAAASCGD